MRAPLFALALALFWLLAPSSPPAGEAATIRASAQALVHGRLDVAAAGDGRSLPATVVHGGLRRATTALGAIVALLPAEALARLALPIDPAHRLERLAESGSAALVAALVCVLFFGRLRADGLTPGAALAFTAVLALATPLCWSARVPDGTALATLLLLLACSAARAFVGAGDSLAAGTANGRADAPAVASGGAGDATRGAAWTLGASLGALVLVEPTLLLAALVVVAWCGVHRHARLGAAVAARVVVPLAAGVALALAHRAWVGARPLPAGALLDGLDGLVLSTGKSLLLYAPPLLLAPPALLWLWRAHRAQAQLLLVVTAAVLLAAARLDDWHGDPTWGPRRALPLTPLLLQAVARAWSARPRRRLLGLTVAAGLWVQLVGLAIAPPVYFSVVDEVRSASGAASWFALGPDECHFIPQFSPIVGHSWLLSHLVRHDRVFDRDPPYLLLLSPPPKLEQVWPRLYLDWFARDWPRGAAAAWIGLLATTALAAAWTLRRRLV